MNATHHDRELFERLCLLRELYARRGSSDREGVISIADAMRQLTAPAPVDAPRAWPSTSR